jgi:hypothetical protein
MVRKKSGSGGKVKRDGQLRRVPKRTTKPNWDGSRLTWRDRVLREYRRPAPGQMAVLNEFERLGWPQRIDVQKLKPPGVDWNHWTRDTARNLNHGLVGVQRVRFHADGTKKGMWWWPVR